MILKADFRGLQTHTEQIDSDPKIKLMMIKLGYQEDRKKLTGNQIAVQITPKNDRQGMGHPQVF